MSGILNGKKGIIFGALDEKSLAWQVALKAKEQGAEFVLSNAPVALRFGKVKELAELTDSELIPADATSLEDLEALISKSMEILGGKVDFVLHSIGMSVNIRKNIPYTEINYDYYMKALDISGLSFHKILQSCWKLDAINDWGSVVALSHIAAQRGFPGYGDMAEAKAVLESVARNFGQFYGKRNNVRINTISQSPTPTAAGGGIGGFDAFFNYSNEMAPLGNASAQSCAEFCVAMFSDFTRMVTMQNLYHDGGFSTTGVSESIMEKLS